eukprot:GHVU01135985.1.p1 GENE.GHVU01135985.1~~GHVU01135985.1.p1  ORF type:complete len:116 (+),score=4.91 GHVU01135985.1:196-543(+)
MRAFPPSLIVWFRVVYLPVGSATRWQCMPLMVDTSTTHVGDVHRSHMKWHFVMELPAGWAPRDGQRHTGRSTEVVGLTCLSVRSMLRGGSTGRAVAAAVDAPTAQPCACANRHAF